MKKFLTLLLAALLIFGLVACGETPETTDTATAPTDPATAASTDSATDPATDPATDTGSSSGSSETVYASPEEVLSASDHWLGVTDQRNSRLVIYDLAVADWNDPKAVVWEYKDDARVIYPAGIKFRHNEKYGGDVVMYCGKQHAGIISLETKEMLFYTNDVPNNPHTVELLPDGTFLVGGTQGEALYVYDPLGGSSNRHTAMLQPKIDVHGVLWDPEYGVLWVAGAHNLKAYALSGGAAKLKFTAIGSMTTDQLPTGVHDLAPVYGDTSKLWITSSDGVIQVDKDTMKYSKSYTGSRCTANNKYTPGVGNFPDGVLAWIVPNENMEEWTSDELFAYVAYGNEKYKKITYTQTKDAWYKCRVFCTDYQ